MFTASKLKQQTVSYEDGTTTAPPGQHFAAVEITVTNGQSDRPADLPVSDLTMVVPGGGATVTEVNVFDEEAEQPVPVTDISLDDGGSHTYVLQTTNPMFDLDYATGGFAVAITDPDNTQPTIVPVVGAASTGTAPSLACATEINRLGPTHLGSDPHGVTTACPAFTIYEFSYGLVVKAAGASLAGPTRTADYSISFCGSNAQAGTAPAVYQSSLCTQARATDPAALDADTGD